MKNILFLIAIVLCSVAAKSQSCDSLDGVAGRQVPVMGFIETYPNANDTTCWYWNRYDVQTYTTAGIAYAVPAIGVAAFSSTTVCPVSNSHSQPGAIIAVQDFTSGKVLYVPSSSITGTGFNVNYAAAAISDSFYYWIWNHK